MKTLKLTVISVLGICSIAYSQARVLKGKLVDNYEKGEVVSSGTIVFKGPKRLVAVDDFENKVENTENSWYRNPKLGAGMSEMLVTALTESNNFIVLEREELNSAIIKEQDLATSGRAAPGGHAKIGKILQAQALIKGAVTLFEENTKGKSGGIAVGNKNVQLGIGGSGGESQVAVDIRIFDTATSQILASKTCKGFSKSQGRALSLGLAGTHHGSPIGMKFGGADFKKTPLGDATRDAIEGCVNFIISELNKIPWEGKILDVMSDGKIIINCGQRNNIKTGELFSVFKTGKVYTDPETGEVLGSDEKFIGRITVISLKEKMSTCISESGEGFETGNTIKWTAN